MLGRGIGLDAGQAGGEPGAARDGDDTPGAGLLHAGRHGAGEQEAAFQVDVDDAGELLGLHFFQGLGPLPEDAACDVDQHVDLAAGRCDDLVDAAGIGDVDGQGFHARAPIAFGRLDLADQPVAGEDLRAVGGEGAHDRAADAASGAGHDHNLAVEADQHQARSSKAVSFRVQMTAVDMTAAAIR